MRAKPPNSRRLPGESDDSLAIGARSGFELTDRARQTETAGQYFTDREPRRPRPGHTDAATDSDSEAPA